MIRVYKVEMDGRWAGGMVIVAAKSEENAKKLANDLQLYNVHSHIVSEIPELRSLQHIEKVLAFWSISE